MKQIVFFLEEPSAKAMLEGLLPRVLPVNVTPRYVVFEGKQDLEKHLGRRLRGWHQADTSFIILRDQDSGDCKLIKDHLLEICRASGREDTIVRIACRELESWYFGDLAVVGRALNLSHLAALAAKAKYRVPDKIVNPSAELRSITAGKYQKVGGSRMIGQHLSPNQNTSHSFCVFLQGVLRVS